MREKIYKVMPNFIKEILISLYNFKSYGVRQGGNYYKYLERLKNNSSLTFDELSYIQKKRYNDFVNYCFYNSDYYNKKYKDLTCFFSLDDISKLPILSKEELRENIDSIIINKGKLVGTKTGGTTGKSLEVKNTEDNRQERFAFLDYFRGRYGYKLGKRTAWFSGKSLLTKIDLQKKRFWKTDHIYKVRYYSTFHIKDEYMKYYIENLIKFSPEYLVGFPSTMNEIAKYGLLNMISFPENTIKAIFPTSETITVEIRNNIESFFKAKMYNQYASSEGAPFIFECEIGNLHIEMQSGVFEVLDDNNMPSQTGRLVVTSFTTCGTPLIRYDIGDHITLEDKNKVCKCGNCNPLVREILGRKDDFIYSPEMGKLNLGNISNTLKGTTGIIKFQVVQNELDSLLIFIVIDKAQFSSSVEVVFMANWRERVGERMALEIIYVDDIGVEKSGKYRIVKNNIKHLL